MILLTLDKTMYTIASGKGIPVLNLKQFNKEMKKSEVKQGQDEVSWTGTYLRERFVKAGFVGGVKAKSMLDDATKLLKDMPSESAYKTNSDSFNGVKSKRINANATSS